MAPRLSDNCATDLISAQEIATYFDRLWPLLRSLTGDGVRRSHDILGEILPLERMEIPSGAKVFDWQVPKEWVVREAYLIDPQGRRRCDVAVNNLHLLNYSAPFIGEVDRVELDKHLYSLPELPDAIPYQTSYYKERWGFCLSQRERDALPDGIYHVHIDTQFVDGSLTISESVLPGEDPQEVLISTYTCHPSMANNELSGPLVAAFLYRCLASMPRRRLTYRFVFLPESIGSIAYLSLRGDHFLENLVAGYVVTCVGGGGPMGYKRSQRQNTLADRAAEHVLAPMDASLRDFDPGGSDEKHYCSPGFDLPVGVLTRTMFGEYPQYHTSLDDRSLMDFPAMVDTIDTVWEICRTLDAAATYRCLFPFGEPMLGKRGLYPSLSVARDFGDDLMATKWVLNQSNGRRDLLTIAQRSGLPLAVLDERARLMESADVLKRLATRDIKEKMA